MDFCTCEPTILWQSLETGRQYLRGYKLHKHNTGLFKGRHYWLLRGRSQEPSNKQIGCFLLMRASTEAKDGGKWKIELGKEDTADRDKLWGAYLSHHLSFCAAALPSMWLSVITCSVLCHSRRSNHRSLPLPTSSTLPLLSLFKLIPGLSVPFSSCLSTHPVLSGSVIRLWLFRMVTG